MEGWGKKGDPFGPRTPPLTEVIKNILERYPDGGQILKELIQNADDAGATDVKFLYDNRRHGIQSLQSPELARFQGPALYCHNNATFQEEDWEGIQNLMRSNKKDDPLKVGRFGIGFNSVYHITDLPGIVSKDTVGFLDPHETYFGRGMPGQRYDVRNNLLDPSSRDQFAPFDGIFDCDLGNAKIYDGTLFRFPLRTTPSELSKKNYTKEMVDNLFESLRKEASVILLFLKSVQSISVHERREDGEIECVFKVEVAEATRQEVKRKREEFLKEAKEPNITESKYVMNIQATFGSNTQTFNWLIVNQIDSTEKRIAELAEELHLLSWVGIAVPLDANTSNESAGRIFCFLPLTPDVDCQTGLPVHVHGYFGVTENRRGLVWPGDECQNNETGEWNELLLKKIAVEVYLKIFEALVENEPNIGIGEKERSQLVYSTLPVPGRVRGHWNVLSKHLFRKLVELNKKLFFAHKTSGYTLIVLNEGLLDRLQDCQIPRETRESILKILLSSSHVVITGLPQHVLEIVARYFSPPRDITPGVLRAVLRNQDISTTPRKEKLLLLEYVLGDDPSTDLSGVPLLPLVSGTFSKFCPNNHARTPSTSVFVPNEACRASLLPNMKHRFLDETLPDTLTAKLRAMAAEETQDGNPTQLVHLTKEIVLQNLRSSLPTAWFSGEEKVQWIEGSSNHPPESWFKVIWDWIHSSFPDSLSPFKGIPLIKLPASRNKCLGVLSPNSKFIFDSDGSGNTLPLQVTSLLTACGCTVIHDTSSYLYHPDIKSYIAPPTPVGTITVLNLTTFDTLQEYIKQTDSNDRSVIREFFCRLPEDVSIDQKRFLLRLSLFDRLDGSATPVQVNGQVLKVASPQFDLPDGFNFEKSDQIISSTTPNSYQLLSLLNVEILKPAEVLRRYLFPDIQTGSVYTTKETSGIMLWVIKQMFIFKTQRDGFQDEMKVLPFVPTDKGELKKPSELYDPNDVLLVDLFLGETTKFPTGDFANENVVPELKELGLRKRDMLTATELLEVAVKITSDPVSQTYISKAEALVKILEDNPVYPNQYVDGRVTLKDKLLRLKWLPCAKHPPKDSRFPEFMPWYDSNSSFFSPTELRSKSQVLLVGSSMPILDTEMSEELHDKLGLTSDPPLHQVISQLEIAVRSWQEQHQKKGSSQLEEMLIAIYLHLSQIPKENVSAAINNAALKQWIWQGTGFCSPPQLALEQDFPLDLRPQLFLLPDVLNDKPSLKQFFLSHGVRERFNEEDILGVLDDLRNKHEKLPPEVNASSEVERDLKLCRSILEWVVKDGETLEENLQEKVLVPVQNGRDGLVLEPCKKCTFCDQDWLRRGGSEFDIPEDYSLIHESVPVKVARLLGVPALSTCLVSAETLGFEFEQTGPHEPITTRLNNILKEYKEGVGVFKELIQNADDAGASKVRFLVDWRHGPKQKLLSPKMAECQGPALWAYNNAVFTDKDFKNINMLAGATKVKDLGKIGRFGLGFNAVYNLTDVPSFVSREYFVVFDPNVHHLEGHIKDKSRPGIRINLATNQTTLSAFEDQFQPYHNVFDCKTGQKQRGTFYYEGTLFRFPFRTSVQKKESEICQSVYDEEKVKDLVCSLKQSASLLLLYAQHVNQVELYEIKQDSSPIDMELQLSVTKNTPEILRSESRLSRTFIEECSYWWQKNLTCSDSNAVKPSRLELVTVSIRDRACSLSGSDCAPGKQETWLLTHCVGTDSSVHLAKNKGREYGLLPCAGAGVKISVITDNESDVASFFYPESVQGEAFCFLPLSIPTGLPVHLNSYFAITSNRRRIWERNTSDICQPIEVLWNESLMEDALSNAYIKLLKDMKRLSEDGTLQQYDSYMLWPCYDSLCSTTWETLVKSFYLKLVEEALPLFCSSGKWLSIHESYILDEKLWNIPQVAAILKFLKLSVLQLPSSVCTSLEKSGHGEVLDQRTLTLEKFLKQVFFPNITKLVPELRDPIICYGLDCILNEQSELVSLFKETPCITCSTDGRHLAKPRELIDPNGAAAILFSKEDHRFPVGEHFLTEKRLYVLRQLGMVKDLLTWNEICERAKSVENFQELKQGQGRARNLIKYLGEKLKNLTKINEEEQSLLRRTKFLPFKSEPPDGYFLPWKGSTRKKQFVAPVDLFLRRDQELVGSSSLIIDDSYISGCGLLDENVKELLGFSESRPEIEKVIQQLDTTIRVWSNLCDENRDRLKTWMVKCTCKNIYEYLEMFVSQKCEEQLHSEKQEEKPDSGLATLFSKDWLFIQGKFVPTKNVAYKWNRNGAPFLYSLPYDYSKEYHNLLREAGVKQAFDENDFIQALYALQETKKSIPLNEEELKLAACFLNELKDVNNDTIKKHVGKIPLPDINKVLHQSDNLTINLNFWLKDREEDRRYVHRDIPQELALDLGARSLQSRILKKYSSTIGTSFGQHENLTDRLKNILKSYPCDSGILKELVQNADDAQASEIHFVYDTRVHPSERVIQKNAIEIQGPALCVYNDRPFTDKDLEGIKKLGIGSKGNDPENIGRYGVGFNAVYHLTDCPSFISNDDTLVLLDPHCRYTTEAMPNSPGGIFQPIDEEFRKSFCDVLVGYLGEHFDLKGSTMFRLPLRNSVRSPETADTIANPISDPISDEKMKDLLHVFQDESRKMLLFLDHIKKITLSRIGEDKKLERIYQVESTILKREHKEQLKTISSMAKAYKDTATNKIPWKGATYPTTISDDKGVVAKWLVHQCCGAHPECQKDDGPTPDGRQLGLFPRGGIATLVSCSTPVTSDVQSQNIAYCSLPLPIHTSLPVLVNGHFALGSSRRVIWRDTEPYGELTKWNDFLKLRVLAPGYAALIREAKRYIPRCKYPRTDSPYFPDSETTENGLDWYHKLFPNVSIESEWKPLAVEVYRFLGITRAPVLPVVVVCEDTKDRNKHFSRSTKKDKAKRLEMEKKLPRKIRSWFPADESFFMPEQPKHVQEILKLLLRICFPLLINSPHKLYNGFREAGITCRLANPKNTIDFLRQFRSENTLCEIGELPAKLEDTKLRNITEFEKLFRYCKEEKSLYSILEGLPLLLTADNQLRVFDSKKAVYHSMFSDLFPDRTHLFVHPGLKCAYTFSEKAKKREVQESEVQEGEAQKSKAQKSKAQKCEAKNGETTESVPQVMRVFTLAELVKFIPDVLPSRFRDLSNHVPAQFPDKGVLSRDWFTRLWDYLENHAQDEQNEEQVRLTVLNEWAIIPTTCGKLVTVEMAKTVMDMTETGTESERERKVRAFLRKLKCPFLDKDITGGKSTETMNEETSSNCSKSQDVSQPAEQTTTNSTTKVIHREPAVTDPYVAHPHRVADVLEVLEYMRKTGTLDISIFSGEEMFEILQFFQDEYRSLHQKYNKILKDLPLYKSTDGTHTSLSAFSSYALLPPGVPLKGIEKLQSRTGCLFLHWDARHTLATLYDGLGVNIKLSVARFYINHLLRYFSMFDKESQMKYLEHLKKELPISREKKMLARNLEATCCIPDQQGNLHYAKEFFDPRNKVFKLMTPDQFPPRPFYNDESWLDFLKEIGLQVKVSPNQFLGFCEKVANIANQSSNDERNKERSEVLVRFLFRALDDDRRVKFLHLLPIISSIKFIASDRVPELSSIHRQYQCISDRENPPCICYRNSVPWCYQNVVWTSAPLLPKWAQPRGDQIKRELQILEKPTVDTVAKNLENISGFLTEEAKSSRAVPNPDKVQEIMNSIYDFLSENIECSNREVSDDCTETCKGIGCRFQTRPCVYMEDETLIKGEQLSFKIPGTDLLNPFLYTVPRKYGRYQHLLKRLGATEKVTSLQLASLLRATKDRCGDEQMDDDFEKKTKIATVLLLKCVYRESRRGKEPSKISDLSELFLPSDSKSLVKSNELVSKVPLRLVPIISERNYHVLFPLEEYGLPRNYTDKYLAALPEQLRPIPLNRLICEKLDPSCRKDTCHLCQDDSVCEFIGKYIDILRSSDFQVGVARVLRHQKQSNKLTEEEQERTSRFLSCAKVKVKCMESIKTYLVDTKTGTPLEGTGYSRETPGYVDRERDERWTLYVKHGAKSLGFLTKLVNEVMDFCVEDKYVSLLTDILGVDSPSEISEWLTDQDITLFSAKGIAMDELWSDESEDELDETKTRHGPGGRGGPPRPISTEPDYFISANSKEAHRWMAQSLSDLQAAAFQRTARPPFNALACFLSQQVVEKSLKAVLYAKYGITGEQLMSHHLYPLASAIETRMEAPSKLSNLASRVDRYYLPTRYPNQQPGSVVPADAYDSNDAAKAVQTATELVEIVKTLIDWY